MLTSIAVTQILQLQQLAAIKFHDRREAVKKNSKGHAHHIKSHDKDRRNIDAIVLHSMSFDWGNSIPLYDRVNAHFAVLRSGDILYLHDIAEYLYASHDFNRRGIAIEFAGNPPGTDGKAYKAKKFGMHIPTLPQLDSGRRLVRLLIQTRRIRYIYGHRQSCRKICPGPHIWYNVGRWAVRTLGLSSGGEDYSTGNQYCTGTAIPAAWNNPQFDCYAIADAALDAALHSRYPLP
ncbi:MAG TPA: hypothetical protein DEP36_02025 [Gammaproteobacteria bacterium]|nr:hypothetical protein [Gammaproteobacteria bacterium]